MVEQVWRRTRRRFAFITVIVFAALSGAACTATGDASNATPMTLAGPVTPPQGALRLCADRPALCEPEPAGDVLAASQAGEPDLAFGGRSAGLDPAGGSPGADVITVQAPARAAVTQIRAQAAPSAQITPALLATAPDPEPRLSGIARLPATEETMTLLDTVNRDINARISWRPDEAVYAQSEYWTMPLTWRLGAVGDCEDYALEKRHALIEAGVPPGALAIATAHSMRTGFHAVLIVRLETGDVVLDNETPWIVPWTAAGYRWLAVQSGPSLLEWSAVADPRTI